MLFFNCGSTTSIFCSYLRRRILKSRKAFLILSAKFLTAFDYAGDIRLYIPSAASKISLERSSRPIPSGLATELIFPRICINFWRFSVYSTVSTTILPRAFSRYSICVSSLSASIASVINSLASASISISSST